MTLEEFSYCQDGNDADNNRKQSSFKVRQPAPGPSFHPAGKFLLSPPLQ